MWPAGFTSCDSVFKQPGTARTIIYRSALADRLLAARVARDDHNYKL